MKKVFEDALIDVVSFETDDVMTDDILTASTEIDMFMLEEEEE